MKRRKDVIENVSLVFKDNIIEVFKQVNQNQLFFEIGNEITNDVAEAVSIIMKTTNIKKSEIWNIEIKNPIIDPLKCLYWLTGGDKEWISLEHYKSQWCFCHTDFEDEYNHIILHIMNKSKTLGDVRNGFNRYLNLPILYDFAISKGLVK